MSTDRRGFLAGAAALAAAGTARAQPTVAPSEVKKLTIQDLNQLEGEAQKLLPPGPFAYVAGGSGEDWSLFENMRAF